ncbi:hypothetical protein EVA_06594 [gut metagenome]|uniref:Uncharacterized protein n=1 Tax=gut metagenome TaxID=749906 RepID=J9GRT9_9ZZZZ
MGLVGTRSPHQNQKPRYQKRLKFHVVFINRLANVNYL